MVSYRAMTRNDYDNPDEFCPERFLEANPDIEDPRNIVFGYGRRYVLQQRL